MKILFLEDDKILADTVIDFLQDEGFEVVHAKNGEEAWDKLNELATRAEASHVPVYEMVSLVLTDVEMPGMDGYVLTRKIKDDKRFQGIPVLMHSSLSADANVAIGKNVGADIYVPKFDPQELSKAIRQALGEP